MVHIRFGGITNFDEVQAFFEGVPSCSPSDRLSDRISYLDFDGTGTQNVNRLVLQLELETYGQLTIRCSNVTTWRDDQPLTS